MNSKNLLALVTSFFFHTQTSVAWTFQEIRTVIEKNPNIHSVPELLAHLDSEILSNYLLVHTSNSLQQSSFETPRVILFSDDGMFMLAFTGSDTVAGANRVEMIDYNQTDKKFEFHDITFPKNREDRVIFSEKNPKECQGCHRTDLRPNWESYPFWRSTYGSIEESEKQHVDQFPETKLFRSFLDSSAKYPRYKFLEGLSSQTVERMAHRNLDFNRAVAYRNFDRIAAYLKTTPDFQKFKYSFLGAIFRCEVDTFIPAKIQEGFVHPLTYYLAEAKAFDQSLQKERGQYIKRTETFYEPQIVGGLRFLIEGRKMNPGSWSMVLGEETYSLSTGSNGVKELGPMILSQNPELRGLNCKDLKKKSLAAFAQ